MSATFLCPWCGHAMNGYDMFDEEDDFFFTCQKCHKPIVAHVEIELHVSVDKDRSAVEAERALYEKRMRGDWT